MSSLAYFLIGWICGVTIGYPWGQVAVDMRFHRAGMASVWRELDEEEKRNGTSLAERQRHAQWIIDHTSHHD